MELNPQGSHGLKYEGHSVIQRLLKLLLGNKNSNTVLINNSLEDNELIENIRIAKREWENANLNFEYAQDEEIVDYYTYKIKAYQVKYDYYLRKAKEKGIKVVESLNG